MNQKYKKLQTFLGITFLFLLCPIHGKTQDIQQLVPGKMTKECFDFNWQFHKGDIAMKHVVQAGGQGGLTDINVEVITKDTVIDYTDLNSYKVFYPADWKEVNLPHDWCVEGAFVHDDSLGNQPAANGYLPTGIGFYRKEFEIPEADKGKKYPLNLMEFLEIAQSG